MDFLKVPVMLQQLVQKHAEMFSPAQKRAVGSFMQTATVETAPASGEIFGILKQMKETFETNLANSQKEEMQSQKDYEDLKAAKEAEISAGQDLIDTKTQELATADEKNAQSKENLESTRDTLAADTAFLADLKDRCQNMDQEYEERTKTRQLEIAAVGKALAFLSSDEAHDLFTRTFNFVQVGVTIKSHKRAQVSKVLSEAAQKFQDPRLSTLAVSARLDAFTKVKKSIQDMVDKLIKEKEDEIKQLTDSKNKYRDFYEEKL